MAMETNNMPIQIKPTKMKIKKSGLNSSLGSIIFPKTEKNISRLERVSALGV